MLQEQDHIPPNSVNRAPQGLVSTNASGVVTKGRWLFFMRSIVLRSQELVVEKMHKAKGTEIMTELEAIRSYWFNI